MKIVIALSACVLAFSASYGQSANSTAATKDKAAANGKSTVAGTIKNMRNRPMKGVQAFVYKADSTIVASSSTDSAGHYETNGVLPGDYFVKLVYPSRKATIITGVNVKGTTLLNLKADEPEADTSFAYDAVMPKPEVKKK